MTRRQYFTAGFKDGIPICLGYVAVSFTFGIMAKKVGISIFDAVLISLTNVTSAGQFAGLSLIASTASYIEMAITQLIINLRYCLMSCALSQKINPEAPLFHSLQGWKTESILFLRGYIYLCIRMGIRYISWNPVR